VLPALLAIAAILLAALIVRDAFFPAGPAAAAASTATVNVGNVQAAASGTGTVEPNQQQNVNFRVSGTLTEVDVKVGDQVTAGQTLAKIDPTTYQTALNQAQATQSADQATSPVIRDQHRLAQDQAAYALQKNADQNTLSVDQNQYNLDGCVGNPSTSKCQADQAKIDQDQIKLLSDQNTITNDQDTLNADTVTENAKLANDQTAVQTAQQNVNDATLTAPMSGTVLTLNGQVGDSVGSGGGSGSGAASQSSASPGGNQSSSASQSSSSGSSGSGSANSAFLSLGNLSSMQVLAPFAEADAAKVKVNQTASVTFDAITNLTLPAHVTAVAAAATTVSNVTNYYVTLALDNLDQRLKAGMTANASVIVSQAGNVLTVPNSAITHIGTAAFVTVLSSDGKTRTRIPIQTGTVGDSTTEITSGLVQGEKVVLPQLTTSTTTGTTGAGRGLGGGGGVLGGGGGGGGRLGG
jgi:multidrug efflux pump subunit AcrA (membrane-fusion protein)